MKKIDLVTLVQLLFLMAMVALSFFFSAELIEVTRKALLKSYLEYALLGLGFSIIPLYFYKSQSASDVNLLRIKTGNWLADIVVQCGTHFSLTTTACALFEGIFMQRVYGEVYFVEFGQVDIFVMVGLVGWLFWYTLAQLFRMGQEILIKRNVTTAAAGP